jgi:hypothetical protein
MERNKLLLGIGGGIIFLGIVLGVVFYLRSRNLPMEDLLIPSTPSTTSTKTSVPESIRNDLTPVEKKQASELTNAMQKMPSDITQTWSPEFRTEIESTTK